MHGDCIPDYLSSNNPFTINLPYYLITILKVSCYKNWIQQPLDSFYFNLSEHLKKKIKEEFYELIRHYPLGTKWKMR